MLCRMGKLHVLIFIGMINIYDISFRERLLFFNCKGLPLLLTAAQVLLDDLDKIFFPVISNSNIDTQILQYLLVCT